MGCGKSKHDVATGNTVMTTHKSSNDNATAETDNKEIVTTGNEITPNSSGKQEEVENVNTNHDLTTDHANKDVSDENKDSKKEGENIDLKTMETAADHNKDEEEDCVIEGGGEKDEEQSGGAVAERLISRDSPNRYFSSRKDEETVGSVVSEISSLYDSPRRDVINSDKLQGVVVEEPKIDNGKITTIGKDNLTEEVEVATIVNADPSVVVVENKTVNGNEGYYSSSTTKNVKTN